MPKTVPSIAMSLQSSTDCLSMLLQEQVGRHTGIHSRLHQYLCMWETSNYGGSSILSVFVSFPFFFCFLRRCCFVFNNILFVLTVTCMMLTSFETVYLKEEFTHINVSFLCFIFSCLHTLSPILLVLDIWMGHFSACKTPYYIHLEFQKLPS